MFSGYSKQCKYLKTTSNSFIFLYFLYFGILLAEFSDGWHNRRFDQTYFFYELCCDTIDVIVPYLFPIHRIEKVQMTRFVFIAAVICLSVLFGFLFSQFLFRKLDDMSNQNKPFRTSPTPSFDFHFLSNCCRETDGVEFDGDRSVTVIHPIDYPSLSV